jgi:hypothetical protein
MRALRKHRRQMRVMGRVLLAMPGFDLNALNEMMLEHTGDGLVYLGDCELDESDEDDPELQLQEARAQLEDQQNLVAVARDMVEAQRLRLELEHVRKQAEDMSVGAAAALESMD